MNTRTQTLPLWAPLKHWAPADLEIPEVTNGASYIFVLQRDAKIALLLIIFSFSVLILPSFIY
jgi:hypothetical protein